MAEPTIPDAAYRVAQQAAIDEWNESSADTAQMLRALRAGLAAAYPHLRAQWDTERVWVFPFDAKADVLFADGQHRYFSTHCRHGRHDDCSATEITGPGSTRRGVLGKRVQIERPVSIERKPAQCKTCASPCICPCGHKAVPVPRPANLPCCDMHNEHCEPPSELCCWECTEVNHPHHPLGVRCTWEVPDA